MLRNRRGPLLGSFCLVESINERVAEFDELFRHRVLVARPGFEQLEQCVALTWAEFYGSGGTDCIEGFSEFRRVEVLHLRHKGFARVPADDHLAVAECDGDAVEAFRHSREAT
jgi:hypothetical protein